MTTIFDSIPMGKEGLEAVYDWLDGFVARHGGIAQKTVLGKSPDNWDIPAVFVTNRDIPDEDKQIAVVTAARHGQEFGARVVGPEILKFLAGDEARKIRDTQIVIVVPVVNPEGFVLNEFCSSMTSLTKTERLVLGRLFREYPPDMIIDYHSLGKEMGSRHDIGDMEVIIPANTTRWAMDEQIHQRVAQKMVEAAEEAGWPYEIHTLEDLSTYYFGGTEIGNTPWSTMKEKLFVLHMQDFNDHYDIPEESVLDTRPWEPEKLAYTNYTCGPAYLKWHSLVFGMETNHGAIPEACRVAESGMVPCAALLRMGSDRFPWEKDPGYPVNILHGDFRVSIRPTGKHASERRASRTRIWGERQNFNHPQREIVDLETTKARVRYFGHDVPMEFALCLRMRQKNIERVSLGGKEIGFEVFEDHCSTFVHIPLMMERAGVLEVSIRHPAS
ncbi:MAG: M14 family zinc carboxypeptidase [Desulfatiglandales bacterium]